MHVIPDLGCDKEFFSFDDAFLHGLLENLTDQVLIAINGSTVKQAVADTDRPGNSIAHLFRGEPVAAESAHADAGNFLSRGEGAGGYHFGINHAHAFFPV